MHDKFTSASKHFEQIDGEHNTYRDDEVVNKCLVWILQQQSERIKERKHEKEETLAQSYIHHEIHHDKGSGLVIIQIWT